jgi:hypothetical protein
MKKFLAVIGLLVLVVALSIPLLFLKTYIIMDLGSLWGITQIGELGFTKVLGVMLIINLFNMKNPKSDPKDKGKDSIELMGELVGRQIGYGLILLIGWGMGYIIHLFI